MTVCWRELLQLPQGVGSARSEMLVGPFGLSGTMIQTEDHVGSLNSEVVRRSRSQKAPGGSTQMYSNCAQRS